jgi:hypothetical protein
MKMKRVTLGFSILVFSAAFVLSCKKTPNTVPEQDKEVQSAVYASYATYVASDIEMACSFMAENLLKANFYTQVPGTENTFGPGTGTYNCVRDSAANFITMAFNQTQCLDGRLRHGSIFMYYDQDANNITNARYARDYRFEGRISFGNYKVDGWLIELTDINNHLLLKNLLTTDKYDPKTTNLTWQFKGKFKMTHPSDSKKNMIWEGDLIKTASTTNSVVFSVTKQSAINWSKATVSYSGKIMGTTPTIDEKDTEDPSDDVVTGGVSYNLTFTDANPLVRDFQCYPEKIASVATTTNPAVLSMRLIEHHPFVKGIGTFKTGDKYPRQIYYGNEDDKTLEAQCDNNGIVHIKGISYRVDFFK